jgi:hypothetical protein
MSTRSSIWGHFNKIKENDVVVKGQCKYCNAEIKHMLFLMVRLVCVSILVSASVILIDVVMMQHKVFCKLVKEVQ